MPSHPLVANAAPATSLYKHQDLKGQSVLITGATAGIGEHIARRFAELGCKLWLCGRREERLTALAQELSKLYPEFAEEGNFNPLPLDVCDQSKIATLADTTGVVDILINNAGLALGVDSADEAAYADVEKMFQTNVLGTCHLARVYGKLMKDRAMSPEGKDAPAGHVIFISSVAGKDYYEGGSAYCATKAAVDAYSASYRMDVAGTPVRVTCISPGICKTDFSAVRFGDNAVAQASGVTTESGEVLQKAEKVYEGIVALQPQDIADNCVYAATRPAHVQIADMIVYATNQGHAKYVVKRVGDGLGGSGSL